MQVIRQEAIEYDEDPAGKLQRVARPRDLGRRADGHAGDRDGGNIEGFTRDDRSAHVRSHYVAEKTVVAAAGNFDVEAWVGRGAFCEGCPGCPPTRGAGTGGAAKYVGTRWPSATQRRRCSGIVRSVVAVAPAGSQHVEAALRLAARGCHPVRQAGCRRPGSSPRAARAALHGRFDNGQRRRLGQLRRSFGHDAGQARRAGDRHGRCCARTPRPSIWCTWSGPGTN